MQEDKGVRGSERPSKEAGESRKRHSQFAQGSQELRGLCVMVLDAK